MSVCLFCANPMPLHSWPLRNAHPSSVSRRRQSDMDILVVQGRRGSAGITVGDASKRERKKVRLETNAELLSSFHLSFPCVRFHVYRVCIFRIPCTRRARCVCLSALLPPRQTDGMASVFFFFFSACLFRRGPGNLSAIFLSIDLNAYRRWLR